MADTPKVYVICDANCKWEGMTKEQILTAIAQAVSTGEISDIDTGFVQTIKTINGIGLKFFVGTQSEYDALSDDAKENLFAIITNDVSKDSVLAVVEELSNDIATLSNTINQITNGGITVGVADKARAVNIKGTIGSSDSGAFPLVVSQRTANTNKELYNSPVTYNPQTKELAAETFKGNIKGNVTGNAASTDTLKFNVTKQVYMTNGGVTMPNLTLNGIYLIGLGNYGVGLYLYVMGSPQTLMIGDYYLRISYDSVLGKIEGRLYEDAERVGGADVASIDCDVYISYLGTFTGAK